jgi:hypothetical protein
MLVLSRASRLALGILVLFFARPADAQENLDQGKTPAQMFAANCVVCHKKPKGLARPGVSGLDIFLRQHYTASRESAAAIAAYLQSVGGGPAGSATKHKGEERTKTGEKKPAAGKSGGLKSGDTKSGAAKPAEGKAVEPKSSEQKPSESKPSESKPSDAGEAKPAEPKPSEPKPSESKPAAKSEKSD